MRVWPGKSKYAPTAFGRLSRSELMARVGSSRNTTTELKLLTLLRREKVKGWRRNYLLLGKPDFVFPIMKIAVFVDGCFWHGHNCKRNLTPKSNVSAWQEKILGNRRRDHSVTRRLRLSGWRVIRIWECSLARRPLNCVRRIQRALIDNTKRSPK